MVEAADPHAADDDSDKPRRIIKRYSNRKLYDTKDSRYVTLLQIAEMVRSGEEVQIIDNNTKDDLTEVTLAQIIFEEQKAKSRNVPLKTLKDLIHSRTEKVLTDLREGPIGRLIPGRSEPPPGGAKSSDESAPETKPPETKVEGQANARKETKSEAPSSKVGSSLVDHAKGTLEDWQHKMDERIKAVLPSILPWRDLTNEVKRLNERVAELELRLRESNKKTD
jgi:polyhydroxyalkanoate synthesis repressor PhaR